MQCGFGNPVRLNAHFFFSCLVLAIAICCSATTQAQLTNSEINTPGPSGGARLGNFYYVYGRNPATNRIRVRKTNGVPAGGWTSPLADLPINVYYPAAANICNASLAPTKIAVFARRATDGHLMVSLTSTGDSGFSAWQDLGVVTDGAPTATWFKPNATTGGLIVFYRNATTHRCDYKISPDGVDWSAPPVTVFSIVNMQSAPTVVIRTTLKNAPAPHVLHVFYKGPSNVIYRHTTGDLTNWTSTTSDSDSPDPYACRPIFAVIPQSQDPVLTSNIGTCITEGDPTAWLSHHLPQVNKMRAGVMKFQTTFDGLWQSGRPAQHSIPYIAIDNCISAGVKTIVFRTAESRTSVDDVEHFLSTMVFPGTTNRTIAHLPLLFPRCEFVIEVGNEPDHASPAVPAATARANALAVAAIVKPRYPEFRWICSLPTAWPRGTPANQFDYTYLNDFVAPQPGSPPSNKTVLTEYDGVGVHVFTNNDLAWSNATERPLTVLEYALARLPYGKMIHVSEIGLNSRTLDWATKGLRYKNAMYAAPACVHAWEVFCTSAHAQWNTNTHYCLDKIYTDKEVTAVTPGTTPTTLTLSKVTFANTATFPAFNEPTTTWSAGDTVYLGHVLLGPQGNNIDGVYNVLGNTTFPGPAPGANFFWINKDTRGLGTVATRPSTEGPGFTDRYPLRSVGFTPPNPHGGTFPGANSIGAR